MQYMPPRSGCTARVIRRATTLDVTAVLWAACSCRRHCKAMTSTCNSQLLGETNPQARLWPACQQHATQNVSAYLFKC
jgi:hypothetical protein